MAIELGKGMEYRFVYVFEEDRENRTDDEMKTFFDALTEETTTRLEKAGFKRVGAELQYAKRSVEQEQVST